MLARLLVPALVLALAGCIPTSGRKCCTPAEDAVESTESCGEVCCQTDQPKAAEEQQPKMASPSTVNLTPATADRVAEVVGSYKGKVVVVDFWALDNALSRKALTQVAKIEELFPDQGVVCLTVSLDGEKEHSAAQQALMKAGVTVATFRLDGPKAAAEEKWGVAVPTVVVFDREGKQAGTFALGDGKGQPTYEANVLPLVHKLASGGSRQ
jgi:hypothetical protein